MSSNNHNLNRGPVKLKREKTIGKDPHTYTNALYEWFQLFMEHRFFNDHSTVYTAVVL